jgi:hypothetical protein
MTVPAWISLGLLCVASIVQNILRPPIDKGDK